MEKDEAGIKTVKKTSSLATEKAAGGEVDYRTKSGTAWSHNFLNQKPWHPLSYPNQRRKWIAEQTHAQRERRAEEVAREYAQEQEYFRQTALVSKKEQEKLDLMKAVSFMYVKPPGYNAESAKAAETADEKKMQELEHDEAADSKNVEAEPPVGKKKRRVKDLYGRALPTEEEFEVLKNAPRLETGVAARSKPFGIEIRNVKCLRCGKFGHQSGDRECPLKDAIMPIEENRLKRDDPLTAIQAQTEPSEPLKWELKQQPGMSPPRGGFNVDDPNQQIVAEDIFDEYGGFLGETSIPELLTSFNSSKLRKKPNKKRHKKRSFSTSPEIRDKEIGGSSSDESDKRRKLKKKSKRRKQKDMESSPSESSERGRGSKKSKISKHHSPEASDSDSDRQMKSKYDRSNSCKHRQRNTSEASDSDEPYSSKHDSSNRVKHQSRNSSDDLDYNEHYNSKHHLSNRHDHIHRYTSRALDSDERYRSKHGSSNRHKHHHRNPSDASVTDERYRNKHDSSHIHKHHHISASEASDSDERYKNKHDSSNRRKHHHRNTSNAPDSDERYRNKYDSSNRYKHHHSNTPEVSDSDELYRSKHDSINRHKDRHRNSLKVSDSDGQYRSKHNRNDGSKHRHRS